MKDPGITFCPMTDDDAKIVGEGLRNYNLEKVPSLLPGQWIHYNFVARDSDGKIAGGIKAALGSWLGLEIFVLWVHPDHRGSGIGTKLLKEAESKAKEKGARISMVDTFSFQAPGFYLQNGYEVFGELKNFPEGESRIYLRKDL